MDAANIMTIQYYVGGKIVGLSSDLKPTSVPENTTFIESDTFKEFILVAGVWEQIGVETFIVATGGTETTAGDFKIHTFTTSGNFIVTQVGTVNGAQVLVLGAGGGGGGGHTNFSPGGGGASGGMVNQPERPITVKTYAITIGAGGTAGPGTSALTGGQGGDTTFDTELTAKGGSGGASGNSSSNTVAVGGCTGGGSYNAIVVPDENQTTQSGDSGTFGFGNTGGDGDGVGGHAGGGGGTDTAGQTATNIQSGDGGDGKTDFISGLGVIYGGGGGGGATTTGTEGSGGTGGGGNGGIEGADGQNAQAVGSGGGGAGNMGNKIGGTGFSGVCIIRYRFQ